MNKEQAGAEQGALPAESSLMGFAGFLCFGEYGMIKVDDRRASQIIFQFLKQLLNERGGFIMLETAIRKVFSEYSDILYGFTDISYCSYQESYRSALVFAVPYGEQLTPDDYTEERFERGIQTAKVRLETVVAEIEQILQKHQTKYWIPPVTQENETELRALFSFKTAAAHAGIGWFGKNDVIITERYGPRVRLSAILIDEIFAYGEPITVGRCPDNCTKCIDICPCKALKNQQWTIEKKRSEIIDYDKCNRMRSAFIKKWGRKNACGLCLAACPFGGAGQTEQ